VFYQAAEQYLRGRGYRKNFFTHFALPPDRCLYYHHVQRGEDLLAMGPTADGVFGEYLYRHLDYPEYARVQAPALEGGVAETLTEQALRPVVAALMTGAVALKALIELHATPLLDLWRACDLLTPGECADTFELTANGSWFVTQMIRQLHNRAQISAA
jgi:coproporphyrinogen III oxidase-like Fe-S oxidoreductase